HYELIDKLGENFYTLKDITKVSETINLIPVLLNKRSFTDEHNKHRIPTVFISYPRERPQEADFVEALLRRRNIKVFRDDSDFGAGHSIPSEIKEAIFASNIFLATWCKEYACSPWCFDELELALDRKEAGSMEVWIL